MASSAPQSPAHRDGSSYFEVSPCRPSPSKLLRVHQIYMERATSLPPRRLSSPSKRAQVRPRLNQYYTLDHAVSLFQKSQNIIVLTGAGISTSLGVPDFRSVNGVYNLLVDSPYDDPQELFHIDNFKADPAEFFRQAAKVFPRMQGLVPADGSLETVKSVDTRLVPKYSLTHAFLAMLEAKGKLLTNYTQNIDGLELAAGVSPSNLIQCHGTLATATCMSCGKRTTARKYMPVVRAGGVPYCKCSLTVEPKVKSKPRGRSGKKKRKRDEFEDTDFEDDRGKADFPKGLLKPDMTFFGEGIADSYEPRLRVDKNKVDLLVIIGTSLKVEPVNSMLLNIPANVPQIWISKDRCQREGVKVDIELLGECDLVLEEIADRAGWASALKDRLWTREKAFEAKAPAENKIVEPKKTTMVQKGKKNTSPVKIEEHLAMRPKATDETGLPTAVAPMIVMQIKGEETTDLLAPPTGPTSTSASSSIDREKDLPPSSKPSDTTAPGNGAESTVSPPAPKVIVELEEGTRSRWYIRRAKSKSRPD